MTRDLKPIRTKADYKAAMAEVGELWGARSGTPRGDRLDILTTLIDAYEAEHMPMDPPDPVEAIKFRMEQQALTRRDPANTENSGAADRVPAPRRRLQAL
jgi:HTH-type transcriptional regulator/antitoxin HigA